jgi:hypothetical protein
VLSPGHDCDGTTDRSRRASDWPGWFVDCCSDELSLEVMCRVDRGAGSRSRVCCAGCARSGHVENDAREESMEQAAVEGPLFQL